MKSYVEHANITVIDAEHTVGLLLAALPDWSIRGEGRTDDWFGKPMRWYHVGTENSYITIQDGGEGEAGIWQQPWVGVKHIGIVVDDLKKPFHDLKPPVTRWITWAANTLIARVPIFKTSIISNLSLSSTSLNSLESAMTISYSFRFE
ncbi:glyoxalase family protein [Vibrio maritimus]|uniref:Glyoxalase family protein n=1 Tax=Vibrio maritimus TaxID=990268 RepID=A0A090TB42_9VIBR|nr:glyoxalase family protein [Vibrio maritimus]